MERYISMSKLEIASKDSTTPRMSVLRNLLALHSMPLVRLPLLETLTASMFTISMPRDLNGMRSAASKLKTTTQSPRSLGNQTAPRSALALSAVQLMFSMFASKSRNTRASSNSLMFPSHK